MVQAGRLVGHDSLFKALEAMGGNPATTVSRGRQDEVDADRCFPLFGKGSIRADGRKIHPAYLFEVKKPSDPRGLGTITS